MGRQFDRETYAESFNFSLTYADDDYMETFFCIDANNAARCGLRTFDADAGFKDLDVSVVFRHSVSKSWNIAYSLGVNLGMRQTARSWTTRDRTIISLLRSSPRLLFKFATMEKIRLV